jgi:ABC-type multidrug transport system ATPase subunit
VASGRLYAVLEYADNDGCGGELVPGDTVLETEDLTKDFAGFVAVRSVNLRVARGAIHAMIGPNGAGKTTCFNLLTKFLSPTRGRIVFDGRDITALNPADVARLVPASYSAGKRSHRATATPWRVVRFLARKAGASRA